jgi:GNAT superfamily N-acetyltransferase
MVLQMIGHKDPGLEVYREQLGDPVYLPERFGFPFWVFVEGEQVVGRVTVGVEPVRLFAPIGTRFAFVRIFDFAQSVSVLQEFVARAVDLAWEQDVEYINGVFSSEQQSVIQAFMKKGFTVLVEHVLMVRALDEPRGEPVNLRFEKVPREQFVEFCELEHKALEGSQDGVLELFLRTLREELERGTRDHPFVDVIYQMEVFYIVYHGDVPVGVLDIKPQGAEVSVMGVLPEHRRKGYGRQIFHFALNTLREQGKKEAILWVSTYNQVAVQLYESEGFQPKGTITQLIWRKPSK